MELKAKIDESPDATLNIDVDDKILRPGDKISGIVSLITKKALTGCVYEVKVLCQEYGFLAKPNPEGHDSEDLVDIVPPFIKKELDNQPTGGDNNYKVRFEANIPPKAPASFEVDFGRSKGFVRYIVIASCTSTNSPPLYTFKKVKVYEKLPKLKEQVLVSTASPVIES